jgi:hypothetical protein
VSYSWISDRTPQLTSQANKACVWRSSSTYWPNRQKQEILPCELGSVITFRLDRGTCLATALTGSLYVWASPPNSIRVQPAPGSEAHRTSAASSALDSITAVALFLASEADKLFAARLYTPEATPSYDAISHSLICTKPVDIICDNIRNDGYSWGARFNVFTYSKVIRRDILTHPWNPSWHPYLWILKKKFNQIFCFGMVEVSTSVVRVSCLKGENWWFKVRFM